MDGTNIQKLTTLSYYAAPYALIYEQVNNLLIWIDDMDYAIKYLNLSSIESGAQKFKSVHIHRPFELAVHGDYLYWTDSADGSTGGIFRMHLKGDRRYVTETVQSGLIQAEGIASLDANYVPGKTHIFLR